MVLTSKSSDASGHNIIHSQCLVKKNNTLQLKNEAFLSSREDELSQWQFQCVVCRKGAVVGKVNMEESSILLP